MNPKTPPWARLPPSVRLTVLQALLEDGCSLAGLATVSREWQKVIEQHNFARIKLTLPRLGNFRSITRRTRSLVNSIWFCVELEHYSSLEAYSGDTQFISQRDFNLVTKSICILFKELSHWKPSGELLLDISIHSPSDSQYLLKYLTFEPDMPSNVCLDLGDEAGRSWNKWSVAGKADMPIRKTLASIIHEDLSTDDEEALDRELEWLYRLPHVPAVTGLLLRQQSRRRWCPYALEEMLDHFPNLQEVFYEPWRSPDCGSQADADSGYDRLIDSLTRQGLRKLTIFENYNQYYSRLIPAYEHTRPSKKSYVRTSKKALNRTAALGSRELEQFSASFLVDASLFFASCRPSWTWPHLTKLTLTSSWLDPKEAQDDVVKMLTSAAAVACRMPKLETMELWNGRRRLATVFRYQSKPATITWRSTWDFEFLPLVTSCWFNVAKEHGARGLVVMKQLLNTRARADIKSHGDAIHYLKLSNPVVRPISLQQIRTEGKVHSTWEKMRKAEERQDEHLSQE